MSRGERPTRQSGAQRRRPHRALIATPQRSRVTALCSGSYSRPSRVRRRGLFVPELLEQHRTPAVTRRLPAAPSNLSSAPPQAATRLQISRFSLSLFPLFFLFFVFYPYVLFFASSPVEWSAERNTKSHCVFLSFLVHQLVGRLILEKPQRAARHQRSVLSSVRSHLLNFNLDGCYMLCKAPSRTNQWHLNKMYHVRKFRESLISVMCSLHL